MITDLFLSVMGASVSVSLIVVILLLLSHLLDKRYAVKWKYWIWIFLAVRLLIPYSGADGWSVSDIVPQGESRGSLQTGEGTADHPPGQTVTPRRMIVRIPEPFTTSIAAHEKSNPGFTMLDIIAFIWATISLGFLCFHLIGYFYYQQQVRRGGKRIKAVRVMRQVYELKRELQIRSSVCVVAYSGASSPMMTGFLRPVVILPDVHYDGEKLYFILKHELIHWKRKDVSVKLLLAAANAVHWFNPLIWVMRKEAVIDMELSCDERVTQDAGYAVRKAYTETLLSVIHQQCTRGTMISTQFYGGKQIMKKRFQNILSKKRKKNGAAVLACAVLLTVSLGTMIGCSAAQENGEDLPGQETAADTAGNDGQGAEAGAAGNDGQGAEAGAAGNNGQNTEADMAGSGENGMEQMSPTEDNDAENMTDGENTTDPSPGESGEPDRMTITMMKEGEPEEKQAVLTVEDGYSLYLPEGEWQKNVEGIWQAVVNETVCIWVERFTRENLDEQIQTGLGSEIEYGEYTLNGEQIQEYDNLSDAELANLELLQTDGEIIYKEKLYGDGNDVWCVYYCYPEEAEEGWGRELPVIADTFAITVSE